MDSLPNAPVNNPTDDVQKNKVLAAISYIYIISLVLLLVKKDSPFVQFHAKQAFILFLASLVAGFIPIIGLLLQIVILVFMIIGFVAALQGKSRKFPLISDLAAKINF